MNLDEIDREIDNLLSELYKTRYTARLDETIARERRLRDLLAKKFKLPEAATCLKPSNSR